jgi:hypothetical protein
LLEGEGGADAECGFGGGGWESGVGWVR